MRLKILLKKKKNVLLLGRYCKWFLTRCSPCWTRSSLFSQPSTISPPDLKRWIHRKIHLLIKKKKKNEEILTLLSYNFPYKHRFILLVNFNIKNTIKGLFSCRFQNCGFTQFCNFSQFFSEIFKIPDPDPAWIWTNIEKCNFFVISIP